VKLSSKELGRYGEEIAIKVLQEKKITPIFTNWTCTIGEIDIIGRENNTLVFIEVKTRYDNTFSRKHLLDAIHSKKRRKLSVLSEVFLKQHYHAKKWPPYRIDIIGILISEENKSPTFVTHLKGAI
jgi:putative endonuclease